MPATPKAVSPVTRGEQACYEQTVRGTLHHKPEVLLLGLAGAWPF